MKRFLVFFLLSATIFLFNNSAAALEEQSYPLPMAAAREIVTQWLTDHDQRYQVVPEPGGLIRVFSSMQDENWSINLLPRSPLATTVTIHGDSSTKNDTPFEDLFSSLKKKSSSPSTTVQRRKHDIPQPILEQIGTVACLTAQNPEHSVQFSGVFIDTKGLILCTAHDLMEHEKVKVLSTIGTSFNGDIIKIDFDRDLALISTQAEPEQIISLETGRNLLGMGEKIFSIGCPVNLRGTIYAGFINGPPRRVNKQPLWQASLEVQPGSSGSPVFDMNGNFVALIKAKHRRSPGIGFLIPLEVIIDFLNEQEQQ